jgi:hypothetical protein
MRLNHAIEKIPYYWSGCDSRPDLFRGGVIDYGAR